jgi:DNA-binding CsgD family transcriptional regulator
MTNSHLTRNAASPSNILNFERPGRRADASDNRALARQEMQPRNGFAKVQALHRQHDEMSQLAGGVVRALFAAREAAACLVASLTPRERQILELVLAGRPSKIIAWELGINERTVENHRASIMRKTGSTSVPALTRLAIAAAWNGIDEPSVQPLFRVAVAADRNDTASHGTTVDPGAAMRPAFSG